ncbi:MAG: HAMP domain-containing protein [Caulobacteraceae bacterium]|nr:HAMP domain-containing protein [Caulobacteraceae bacterium]
MRLPRLVRTTAFRLTLLFLALFAAAGGAFLAYIYLATAGEAARTADATVLSETAELEAIYHVGGFSALNQAVIERASRTRSFLYLLMTEGGAPVSGSIAASPMPPPAAGRAWASFRVTEIDPRGTQVRRAARGLEERLPGKELLFVGADVAEAQSYILRIVDALWGAAALVIVLGLAGGLFVSRDVSHTMQALTGVIDAARLGDLGARAKLRGTGDELDDLARGLNDMLQRLERSIAGLSHAGDAIAHDLRSPLTRLRARLEAALMDGAAGRGDPVVALRQALDEVDGVLRTFGTVLAIASLEAAAEAPDQTDFDPAALAADVAELYEPLCEEKALDFKADLVSGLCLRANREFVAQALANLLDNAVKYSPHGGAIALQVRRMASGEIELSVTDNGPGVPEAERERVTERFVRLESSRHQPGAGLGLALVAAVAQAHGGRLELTEGDRAGGPGPGLRAALVLPGAGR